MTNVSASQWHAAQRAERGSGWLYERARAERDTECARPWVVLAYQRTGDAIYKIQIEAGFNRWTGEPIYWRIPTLDDERYDLSNAVEVTRG